MSKAKPEKRTLKVVFDTSALHTSETALGSATDLVRQEIVELISTSTYPDLSILWYIPEVVRHEREYQMRSDALKLRQAISKIERILGHNLALTDDALVARVSAAIETALTTLAIQQLPFQHEVIDWQAMMNAAVYRRPPFQEGEKEKGFRDALILETFYQLVKASPKTPSICQIVLLTSDKLLTLAVNERCVGLDNVKVLPSIEELRGLINTLVSNVDEAFLAKLKPKAEALFFTTPDDKKAFYYSADIRGQIETKFPIELSHKPNGTEFRNNRKWYISSPTFASKSGKTIFWHSRISVAFEAGVIRSSPVVEKPEGSKSTSLTPYAPIFSRDNPYVRLIGGSENPLLTVGVPAIPTIKINEPIWHTIGPSVGGIGFLSEVPEKVVTHKGSDIYQVLWSTKVTMNHGLSKPTLHEITHVEMKLDET